MEYSDNTHTNTQQDTLSNAEFQKLAEIFLDFYKDGKYSLEGIEEGESTQSQRKSIKNDFKDHIYGDAKFRKINGKDAKKKWSRYTMCVFRAVLEADIKKYCDLRRKYRSVTKELQEIKNRDPQIRKNEIDAEVRRLLPIRVDERIQERIELADRMNSRIPKYQATIDNLRAENDLLRERLEQSVPRSELMDCNTEILNLKEKYEKAKAKADKTVSKEQEKMLAEKEKRKKKMKQLKKQMEALQLDSDSDVEDININISSSSDED